MSELAQRLRTWLWWLVPLVALALLLAIETDWGRAVTRAPAPAPALEPKPVTAALLPEYRIDGGLEAHSETVARTLFNPTRRPAPVAVADNTKRQMTRGQFVLTGTAVAGDRHIAFLREVNGGKSRVVRQGEQLNGLLVATVGADRVKLTLGDESEELVLKVAVGPKTTTQPPPPVPPPPTPPGAMPNTPLPGAAPPAGGTGAPASALPAVPAGRRVVPSGGPATAFPQLTPAQPTPDTPVIPPAATPPPATAPAATAPAAAPQSTPASADPNWNETFERMRQRNPAPTK